MRDKEQQALLMARYKAERKQKAFNILGGKCIDCGNDDPRVLEFDHLRDKEFGIASKIGCRWEIIEAELQKCELVCSNCHSIRTYERRQIT